MAKLRIYMKNPDSVSQAIMDAGVDQNEVDSSEFGPVIEKFVEYQEYITVELDTDTMEATVIPKGPARATVRPES